MELPFAGWNQAIGSRVSVFYVMVRLATEILEFATVIDCKVNHLLEWPIFIGSDSRDLPIPGLVTNIKISCWICSSMSQDGKYIVHASLGKKT